VVDKRDYHTLENSFRGTTVRNHNEARETALIPSNPLWLLQIPEIVSLLETFDVPVVDRAIIERLFGLRRRQAIELLHRFGGYQADRTFLVDRRLLIDHLRRLADGEEFQRENQRKERLDQTVDALRRQQAVARVKVPVQADSFSRKMTDLSPGVALEAGHLHISFSGTEDLLGKLFELSQAASNDFDRFRAVVEPARQRSA
jgi:hypothetical protein